MVMEGLFSLGGIQTKGLVSVSCDVRHLLQLRYTRLLLKEES